MKYKLRPYQEECIKKMFWSLDLEGNDLISIGQGLGKSIIIAEFAHQLKRPVLVLCLSKELLEQDIEKMATYIPREEIGVYSASMNEKTIKPITFGTVQSLYKHPEKFRGFDIAIYDEADRHPIKSLQSMSAKLFNGANIKKVYGFTGTPFRMGVRYEKYGPYKWMLKAITVTQMINRHYPAFWRRMLYIKNIGEATREGYLTPLTYHDVSLVNHHELPTNKTKSEFDLEAIDIMLEDKYGSVAEFISNLQHNRKLIFCSTVYQAEKLNQLIKGSEVVTAKTPKKKREEIVKKFRDGKLSTLLNVSVFSAGFDIPELDCVIITRPTRSLRLWTQMIGRGNRLAPNKNTCHIYDMAGNTASLGTLESMEIKKIDDKWNVVTDTYPQGLHNEALFEFKLTNPSENEYDDDLLQDLVHIFD